METDTLYQDFCEAQKQHINAYQQFVDNDVMYRSVHSKLDRAIRSDHTSREASLRLQFNSISHVREVSAKVAKQKLNLMYKLRNQLWEQEAWAAMEAFSNTD